MPRKALCLTSHNLETRAPSSELQPWCVVASWIEDTLKNYDLSSHDVADSASLLLQPSTPSLPRSETPFTASPESTWTVLKRTSAEAQAPTRKSEDPRTDTSEWYLPPKTTPVVDIVRTLLIEPEHDAFGEGLTLDPGSQREIQKQ